MQLAFDRSKYNNPRSLDLNLLENSANNNDASALFFGIYLAEGGFNLLHRYTGDHRALDWAKRGFELDDVLCTAYYAIFLKTGRGTPINSKEAERVFAKIANKLKVKAEEGSPYAQTLLGLANNYGVLGKHRNAEASYWFQKAAEQGEPIGLHFLANTHVQGHGGKTDYAEAARLYASPAELGYLRSQIALAQLYETGLGVGPDFKMAAKLYGQAARQGSSLAECRIGELYIDAEKGINSDHRRAMKWLIRSAEHGNCNGLLTAADYLAKGVIDTSGKIVVPQNMAVAFSYYTDIVVDPVFAAKNPNLVSNANAKRSVMLIGAARITEDGKKLIVFKDDTAIDAASAVLPTKPKAGHQSSKAKKFGR